MSVAHYLRSIKTAYQLGFGAAALGNLYEVVDDGAARDAILAAWDAGIRYFDTAPLYGSGLSEKRLGEVLAEFSRDDFLVSTKVGRVLEDGNDPESLFVDAPALRPKFDFTRDGVLCALSESIQRLNIDRVDLVYVHDPVEYYEEALTSALPTLAELRDEGAVRAIGVGMNEVAPLERFIAEADVDCILLANRYTLLDQQALERLLPECHARGISVAAGAVLNGGILADPLVRPKFLYRDAPREIVVRVMRMSDVCQSYGVPLLAAALQFPAAHPAVDAILIGPRSQQEVESAIAAMKFPIPNEMWAELKSQGFIPEGAPVPQEPPRKSTVSSAAST